MKILGYEVEKKKIKSINIRIKQDGTVYISAPLSVDNSIIEKYILSKKEWIDKHIKRINEYKIITKNIDKYINDSYIFLNGKLYLLKIELSNTKNAEIKDNILKIYVPKTDANYVKDFIYNNVYYPFAKKIFVKRLEYYLDLTNEVNDINFKIRTMKGKWGTCIPTKREITLNIELMKKSLDEIDSVVIHEVSHLKYPNHSKNFYNYIDKFFKNYKEINKKLNTLI